MMKTLWFSRMSACKIIFYIQLYLSQEVIKETPGPEGLLGRKQACIHSLSCLTVQRNHEQKPIWSLPSRRLHADGDLGLLLDYLFSICSIQFFISCFSFPDFLRDHLVFVQNSILNYLLAKLYLFAPSLLLAVVIFKWQLQGIPTYVFNILTSLELILCYFVLNERNLQPYKSTPSPPTLVLYAPVVMVLPQANGTNPTIQS